ncbi:MAG: hypothetical protein WA821_21445 [Anaerolineales bacterium]
MKKYLFSAISILVLLSTLSGATTVAAQNRWYGIGYMTGAFKGAQAIIHWANPTVRDSGGFSDETLWVLSTSVSRWVEVGWAKEDPPDSRTMGTYLYYGWNDGTGYREKILEATSSHNVYKIVYAGANNWYVYINGVLRATINAGFSTANMIEVGGEVTSNKSAMGISGTLNLMYKSTGNTWSLWSNTQLVQDAPYRVTRLNPPQSNLQNSGNNP